MDSVARTYSNNSSNLIELDNYYNLMDDKFRSQFRYIYLKNYYHNYTQDEIDIILDWTVNSIKRKRPLSNKNCISGIDVIKFVSDNFLKMEEDGIACSFDHLLEWNGFINKIDYNMFYAAYMSSHSIDVDDVKGHGLYIRHDFKELKTILNRGIAENHMHLKGSGYSVDWSWLAFVMESFGNTSFYSNNFSNQNEHLTKANKANKDAAYFKLKIIHYYIWSLMLTEQNNYADSWQFEFHELEFILSLSESNINIVFLNKLFFEKLNFWRTSFIKDVFEHVADVPMYPIIIQRKIYKYIFDNFHRLGSQSLELFMFNAYLSGVNQFKLKLLHDNNEFGFSRFKHAEDIKTEFIKNSTVIRKHVKDVNELIYRTVFDKYYREGNVTHIEFRVTPRDFHDLKNMVVSLNDMNQEIYEMHTKMNKTHHNKNKRHSKYCKEYEYYKNNAEYKQNDNPKRIKFGIIFHHIKPKLKDNNMVAYRHHKFNQKLDFETSIVRSIFDNKSKSKTVEYIESLNDIYKIQSKNQIIDKLVGIDTANFEIGCRPILFSDAFKKYKNINKGNFDLNFTYHVGEDFNTIAGGIRAIDEVIEFLKFDRGDRLGHAIALGLNVDTFFYYKRNKVHTTLEEHLDDIVWMYKIIKKSDTIDYRILHYLEEKYEIYKYQLHPSLFKDVSIHEYYELYKCKIFPPNKKKKLEEDKLYNMYYYDHEYRKNAQKPILLDICATYIDSIKIVQEIVRTKVINKSLKIETNPTSNFKISFIRKMINLPLFSFNKHHLADTNTKNIPVSINTDDSSIFQTNLSMEYSIVAAALKKEGYPEERILNYIEHLRESSLMHTFVK